jgi:hypothetical protein
MGGGERNRTERQVLMKARKKPLASFEELSEACLAPLTARLWATCCWAPSMGRAWKIGDHNFLIASVEPDRDCSLFVQFWSEPHEAVLAEVGSGEWNPGVLAYMGEEQWSRVEGLGYTVGGRAHNFRKEVEIPSSKAARQMALEVLRIFYDVFEYRGQWALRVEWHQGERAEHEPVHTSLTPEDFAKVARHVGLDAELQPGDQPAVKMRRGRQGFLAGFVGRIPDNNLYTVAVFETTVSSASVIDEGTLARIDESLLFARVARLDASSLLLTMPMRFDGGVAVRWIVESFEHWFAAWQECERFVRAARGASVPPMPRRGSAEEPVH